MRPGTRAVTLAASAAAVLMLAPAASAQAECFRFSYVALGDSYSSGVGAGGYDGRECLRSELAYPQLLADDLDGEFTFAACSGAKTQDLLADQIGGLDDRTDLVTVGIGGNDIGWGTAVGACMQQASFDCAPIVQASRAAVEDELPDLLDEVYSEIAERAPRAEVYVIGYPRLFSKEEPCESIPYVTPDEQELMNEAADVLDEVIEAKADEYDFTYLKIVDDFEGHAICEAETWLHGFTGTVDSFHPNAAGQAGYYAALSEVF